MADQDFLQKDLLFQDSPPLVHVTLNRPKALNALNLDMIRQIGSVLDFSFKNNEIAAVFFEGAGEKAFCAGGDIKHFYYSGMDYRKGNIPFTVARLFFEEEYALNKTLFNYSKPLISFMNGITMGGGYGVAGNCSVRIATDKTLFAMPETRLGFCPDVGSMYHLTRCAPPALGCYLALTGASITGAEMKALGLADLYMAADCKDEVIKVLRDMQGAGKPDAAEIIDALRPMELGAGSSSDLSQHRDVIEACFLPDTLEAILNRLSAHESPFAVTSLDLLNKRSVLSLEITLEHFRRSSGKAFNDVIAQDFILVQNFIQGRDFYEGIRTTLIDRDDVPSWDNSPHNIKDMVERYFLQPEIAEE